MGSGGATGNGGFSAGGNLNLGGYWGGDGIAPPLGGTLGNGGTYGGGGVLESGGSAMAAGGGGGGGGRVGDAGVDPNCYMRCGQGNAVYASTGGIGGARDAMPVVTDTGANDCESRRQAYYAAVAAAGQCDPTSATPPCAAYDGVECPTVGVNPTAVAGLSAKLAEYKAAGCSLPIHSCPVLVMTPAPYTCQPGSDGVYKCYSVCEQMISGRATCVSQSTGCAGMMLTAGFCTGTSMVCCAP
jgi:hypothetical protein